MGTTCIYGFCIIERVIRSLNPLHCSRSVTATVKAKIECRTLHAECVMPPHPGHGISSDPERENLTSAEHAAAPGQRYEIQADHRAATTRGS